MTTPKITRSMCELLLATALLLAPALARAQVPDSAKITLTTTPVTAGLTMIEGANGFAGGNVIASVGDDGLFIVDDELQPMTALLKAALAGLSKKPVRFIVNTHWHPDHTGGNLAMGTGGAVIVAQDNVRKRLSVEQARTFMGKQMVTPATPPSGLPVVTFTDDVTLHLNGDEVHVVHVPPAHTDGDSIVHFKKANVIHTGDAVIASYPLVDADSGGQFEGFIAAADKVLALADDATKIVPGHGAIMTKADVAAWRQMLVAVRDRVAKLDGAKKTLDEMKAAKPLADLDARWGQGMIKADFLIDTVVKTKPPAAGKPKGKKPKK
jgi:glyoxylase-like metal-dependent hydrolase (beta-lactamase superfamily II)